MNCPQCASHSTKKCSVAYDQNISFSSGSVSNGETFNLSSGTGMSERVSPPTPPVPFWILLKREIFTLVCSSVFLTIGVISVLRSLNDMYTLTTFDWSKFSYMGALFVVIPTYMLLRSVLPIARFNFSTYQKEHIEYNLSLQLYHRLWVCMDCGKIFEGSSK